ncbi:hypothetical protein [Nocardia takedensis]|uniref:hypothetical protein n=1 Tax=Nocardia takedensis TaxID=259390 RepID=UPI0002EB2422|nr:hypothetical protein [Nocardia takedensis]
MARLAPVTGPADTGHPARRPGVLTFADVPARLRPSAYPRWLAEVPRTPRTDDERDAAYGGEDQPNPYDPRAPLATLPVPAAHWREQVASQRHHDAYIGWLAERGLLSPAGVAPVAWRWSALTHWERVGAVPA